jgi:hypothetical protein
MVVIQEEMQGVDVGKCTARGLRSELESGFGFLTYAAFTINFSGDVSTCGTQLSIER